MLETRNLESSIAGTQLLRGASLTVAPGTTIGLIGRNGAGKTTFMRSVMGLLRPDRGEILLDGTDVALGDNDGLRAACLAILSLLQNSCTMFANENKLLHIFVKL